MHSCRVGPARALRSWCACQGRAPSPPALPPGQATTFQPAFSDDEEEGQPRHVAAVATAEGLSEDLAASTS